ncbi:hypothetical protein JBE38_07565 [Pseudomonas sp. ICBG1301]|uniref:hypothetical protein n=1 Tax=Pseudomonas sp. ICBG1301 TaxID=2795987 RepID=UPI0019656647|nr:hypothetical protein [Pseudomonas sp. ICBG1301]MBM9485765.1 hypothetical protein [Pseudomonas sp. ICBG1301]
MEWNEVLRDVGVRFKYRSWLLIDLSPDELALREPLATPGQNYSGMALILDCSLESMFQIVDGLGPGISYAASLQASKQPVVAVPARRAHFQDFRWAC